MSVHMKTLSYLKHSDSKSPLYFQTFTENIKQKISLCCNSHLTTNFDALPIEQRKRNIMFSK